jgi:uncharacterized protein (DUF2336 family)
MTDPTPKARAETAAKIAEQFESRAFGETERAIAEDIFRVLVKDAEVRVREALSTQLKSCSEISPDIALALAKDVDSVSLPMLKFSEVLSDQDLLDIIGDDNAAKQTAIAQRRGVSEEVADALIDSGNESAVARLVANETARISETAFGRVMDDYAESDAVSDSLSRRPSLPTRVSERLVSAIAERLQAYLSDKHDLPADSVCNMLLQAREQATVSLLGGGSSDAELEQLIEQLYRGRRLTPWLILRALCMGDIIFFEVAVAKMANVSVQKARSLIHDQKRAGLKSIFQRAGLPDRLFPAFRVALDVAGETGYDGGPNDRERLVGRMIERLLTQVEHNDVKMSPEDVDYLMGKLQQLAA